MLQWTDLYATEPELLENDLIPKEKQEREDISIQR